MSERDDLAQAIFVRTVSGPDAPSPEAVGWAYRHADDFLTERARQAASPKHARADAHKIAGLADDFQFVTQALTMLIGGLAVAALQALLAELAEVVHGAHAVRDAGVRELGAAVIELQVDGLGEAECVVRGLG